MRVAVVMPAYQAEAFVGEAIGSVLAQTLGDWELVVVDDGSTDTTVEAAETAAAGDDRIRVVRSDHQGLPAVARNRGIALTSAPVVAFLDADDVWHPTKLERQLDALGRWPEVGLVHAAAERLVDGQTLEPHPVESEDLLFQNFIVCSSVVLRRELLDVHGVFDTDPRLRGTEDYDLWLRLEPHTELAFIDEPLLAYRVHGEQLSEARATIDAGLELALRRARSSYPGRERTITRSIGILRCVQGASGRGRRELAASVLRRPTDGLAWSWLARSLFGIATVRSVGHVLRRGQVRSSASS
jgi:glycosyltransferase involved in cell wall biosynthesis